MKAIDAAEELLRGWTRPVGTAFSQSICECRPPIGQQEVAGRLMEMLWEEATAWLSHWKSTEPPVPQLKACARLWLLERTVKCRWAAAKQIAARLLDEEAAATRARRVLLVVGR